MTKTRRLLALCLCVAGISGLSSSTLAEESREATTDLEEILQRLEDRVSGIQTLRTDFVQQKYLAVLEEPLVLKGTISMQKPDLFSWVVREPLRYSMVVRGEVVEQWDEDTRRVEKISLSKNPVFEMAIQQLRDWLSGAYRSMLGEYEVTVLGEEPISLEFIPRDTALSHALIDRVTVVFDRGGQYIRKIEILEKRGDRTVLTFVDVLLNTPIAPSAWKAKQDVR